MTLFKSNNSHRFNFFYSSDTSQIIPIGNENENGRKHLPVCGDWIEKNKGGAIKDMNHKL